VRELIGVGGIAFSRCHIRLHVRHSNHVTPLSLSYERGASGRIFWLLQEGQCRSVEGFVSTDGRYHSHLEPGVHY